MSNFICGCKNCGFLLHVFYKFTEVVSRNTKSLGVDKSVNRNCCVYDKGIFVHQIIKALEYRLNQSIRIIDQVVTNHKANKGMSKVKKKK